MPVGIMIRYGSLESLSAIVTMKVSSLYSDVDVNFIASSSRNSIASQVSHFPNNYISRLYVMENLSKVRWIRIIPKCQNYWNNFDWKLIKELVICEVTISIWWVDNKRINWYNTKTMKENQTKKISYCSKQ